MTDEITLDAPETRIERFLAAAAGVEGITLDEPETRIERYLKAICDRLDSGGSGGGALVVTDTDGTLDKTWQEIHDAMLVGGAVISTSSTDSLIVTRTRYNTKDSAYEVTVLGDIMYFASSADGYPAAE